MINNFIESNKYNSSAQMEEDPELDYQIRLTLDYHEDFWLISSIVRILGPVPERGEIIKLFKEKLGEKVSDVRISNKLVGSPSCLVADDTGMDIQMERIMKMHDKDFSGMPRILELNENHELLNNLNKIIDKNTSFVEDASLMLFDQAKILEGQLPSDLSEFSTRLTDFINKSIPK